MPWLCLGMFQALATPLRITVQGMIVQVYNSTGYDSTGV